MRLFVESVRSVSVDGKGAEGHPVGFQRERERGPIAALERLIPPGAEARVRRDVVCPAKLAGSNGNARGPAPNGRVGNADIDAVEISLVKSSVLYPSDCRRRVSSRYPTQAIRMPPSSTRIRQMACTNSISSVARTSASLQRLIVRRVRFAALSRSSMLVRSALSSTLSFVGSWNFKSMFLREWSRSPAHAARWSAPGRPSAATRH
jgi:hypothetical protein